MWRAMRGRSQLSEETTVFEGSLADAASACEALERRGVRARLIELPVADHPEGMLGTTVTVYGRVCVRRQDWAAANAAR